jgi:hypothetical protein
MQERWPNRREYEAYVWEEFMRIRDLACNQEWDKTSLRAQRLSRVMSLHRGIGRPGWAFESVLLKTKKSFAEGV